MTEEYRYCKGAIREAIKECIAKPNYHVGICYSNRLIALYDLDEEISDFIDEVEFRRRFNVKFKNGSTISILTANDCARGRRIHRLIVDSIIDDTVKDSLLKPLLIKYEE